MKRVNYDLEVNLLYKRKMGYLMCYSAKNSILALVHSLAIMMEGLGITTSKYDTLGRPTGQWIKRKYATKRKKPVIDSGQNDLSKEKIL